MLIFTKLKQYALAIVAGFVAIAYLVGIKKGKENARNEQNRHILESLLKSKKARDSLDNPAVIDKLHDKYKR